MYQAVLTRRYMTSRVMPLLSAVAVLLCTALVLTSWSIMGGFLVMLLEVGHKMEGDVSITWPTAGFGHYEDLIERLEKDKMVKAACPTIDTFGMINLPDDRVLGVKIRGVDERFGEVTEYKEFIWWKPIDKALPKDREQADPRLQNHEGFKGLYDDGLRMAEVDSATGEMRPAVVLGIELGGFSIRQAEGFYWPAGQVGKRSTTGGMEWISGFMPMHSVTLNVLPLDRKGRAIGSVSRKLPVANEYRTGLFDADKQTVLINLGELQRMLKMDQGERLVKEATDPYAIEQTPGGEATARRDVIGIDPARVTTILVKAVPGVDGETLRTRCEQVYAEFAAAHPGEVPSVERMADSSGISTWERIHATFVGAVRHETAIVIGMLLFISVVCVFLMLAIFWSIVSEKTKDIGTLRAVGASAAGVAWLWLRYGLTIGLTGTLIGGFSACLIVWNINPIHEWLGRNLGLQLWDPNVYYFPEIPNKVEPAKAAIVMFGGVVFSVLGALIPALKAASMDPVKALRFE